MDDALLHEIMQRAATGSMFGRTAPPGMPVDFNVPGMQNNPLAGVLSQMLFAQAAAGAGGLPAQFMPTQNLFDQHRSRLFWQQHAQALQQARSADEATYVNMFRGAAQMTGTPMGLEQERMAQSMARDVSGVMPLLVQFAPDMVDQLHGTRGSAMVMASQMFQGGRFGVDPLTGRAGVSGASAGAMATELHSRFFAPGADLSGWKGFGAGQIGSLYREAMTRGLMGPSIGTFDQAQQLQMLTGNRDVVQATLRNMANDPMSEGVFSGLMKQARGRFGADFDKMSLDTQIRTISESDDVSRTAMEEIRKASPSQFDAALRQFDARKVADRLKNLTGAVSAMRDIFGDMGRPNAPMSELIEGLQQLTQGGMANLPAADLEKLVRMSHSLSAQTGMGMTAMMGMTAQGAAFADQLGLERVFAVQATQGAAAFGAAFRDVGRGDLPAWGRRSMEQLTMQDQQLRLRGAESTVGNQIGATMRLAEQLGFKAGTPMAAMAEAIRAGKTEFRNPTTGQMQSVDMSNADWMGLAASSGIDGGTANSILFDKFTNQEFTFKFGGADIARRMQGRDVERLIGQEFNEGLMNAAMGAGADRKTALAASRAVAPSVAAALRGMGAENWGDDTKRNKILADKIKQDLGAQGIHISDAQATEAAMIGWGNYNERVRTDGAFRWAETGINLLDLTSDATLARQGQQTQQARVDATMRQSLSGLGQAGPLRRLSDMIQNPAANGREAIARLLGLQDPAAIANALATTDPALLGKMGDREALAVQAYEMSSLNQQYQQLIDSEKDPTIRAQKQESIAASLAAMRKGGSAADQEIARLLRDEVTGGAGKSISDILARKDLPPELRDRLIALQLASGGGYDNRAAGIGFDTGTKIGAADVDEAFAAATRSLDSLAGGAVAAGDKSAAAGHARRAAGQFAGGRRMLDLLLNDSKSVEQLGAGGFAVAKRAYQSHQSLAVMAREKGYTSVEALLLSGDADARALQSSIGHDLQDMKERMGIDPSARVAMSDEEKKALLDFQSHERRSDQDLNAELIGQVVSATGARVDAAAEGDLAAMLGSGEGAMLARSKLSKAVNAREQLANMARSQGISLGELQRRGGRDVAELVGQAGGLMNIRDVSEGGEGLGADVLRGFLEAETARFRRNGGDPETVDGAAARPTTVRLAAGTTIRIVMGDREFAGEVVGAGTGHAPLTQGS